MKPTPRAEYLTAMDALYQHVKCCAACASRCVECLTGMRLADEAVRLRPTPQASGRAA